MQTKGTTADSLPEFIKALNPQYKWPFPEHVLVMCKLFENLHYAPGRILLSMPPQHAKTETAIHGMVWNLRMDPSKTHAFLSYNEERARSVSHRIRWIAERSGIEIERDARSLHHWKTLQGGGIISTGFHGTLTGEGVNGVILVDDPYKDHIVAHSKGERTRIQKWFTSAVYTRVHNSTSIIIIHTRWHLDDMIGQLSQQQGWTYINFPAINKDGKALWPSMHSAKDLDRRRVESNMSEYEWEAMYQGNPRPRGGQMFEPMAAVYNQLPPNMQVAIGMDFAYTQRARADFSVAVVMGRCGNKYYMLDGYRGQCKLEQFQEHVRRLQRKHMGAPAVAHCATTEEGIIALMQANGVHCKSFPARGDKMVRAEPLSAAWNRGDVLFPAQPMGWDPAVFKNEAQDFTGAGDRHDDCVDAMASAFCELSRSISNRIMVDSKSRDAASLNKYY